MQNGDVDSRDFYFNRAYAAVSACLAISGFAIFAISAGYERASESLIALRFAALIVSSAVALTLCAITWVFIYRPYVRFFAGRIEVRVDRQHVDHVGPAPARRRPDDRDRAAVTRRFPREAHVPAVEDGVVADALQGPGADRKGFPEITRPSGGCGIGRHGLNVPPFEGRAHRPNGYSVRM